MKQKMIDRLKSRMNKDDGASTTIEFLFTIIVLFMFTMSVIDLGLYFNNRMVVTNAAQDGSRLVAIYGGNNDTTISKQGYNQSKNCSEAGASSAVECTVVNQLKAAQSSTVNMKVTNVDCGPGLTELGERTWCTIKWTFPGVPGSALSIFRSGRSGAYTLTETSNAEVIGQASK